MEYHLFLKNMILGSTILSLKKLKIEEFLLECCLNIFLGCQLSNKDIESVKFLSFLHTKNQDMEKNSSI